MKIALIASLSLCLAAGAASATDTRFVADQASATDTRFVADQASVESQLCIKAATGAMSLADVAGVMGVNVDVVDRSLHCNGAPVSKFVGAYQHSESQPSASLIVEGRRLAAGHASPEARLCVIAASGDIAKLKRATRAQGLSVKSFVKYNRCNNQSVGDFVATYGDKEAASRLAKYI